MSYPKAQLQLQDYDKYNGKLRSLRLTPTQRKKLLNSHRQEEIKTMILYKYLEKRSLPESLIRSMSSLPSLITVFLQKEKLTEKSLSLLYDTLQARIKVLKSQDSQPKEINKEIALEITKEINNNREIKVNIEEKDDFRDSDSEKDDKSLYKGNELDNNEWSMIVKYRQRKYEEELKEKQEKERLKKLNFKRELDRQLAMKKELKNLNFQQENTLESKIREFQSQQENRLSEKNLNRKKLLLDENKARDAQFKDLHSRSKVLKKAEAEIDKSLVNKAKEDLWKEHENNRKKKEEYRGNLKKIMVENEENRKKVNDIEGFTEKALVIKALTEEAEMQYQQENMKRNECFFRESRIKEIQDSVSMEFLKEKLEKLRKEEVNQAKYLEEFEKNVRNTE